MPAILEVSQADPEKDLIRDKVGMGRAKNEIYDETKNIIH